jgi:hypothetical protein
MCMQRYHPAFSGPGAGSCPVQGEHIEVGICLLQTQQQLFAGHVGQASPPVDPPARLQATLQLARVSPPATVSRALASATYLNGTH